MNKIVYVILREYLTRVREKSFIFTTISVPLLMLIIVSLPTYLDRNESETENRKLALIGNVEFIKTLLEKENYEIINLDSVDLDNMKSMIANDEISGALLAQIDYSKELPIYQFYYKKQPKQLLLQKIESFIQKKHVNELLEKNCSPIITKNIQAVKNNIKLEITQIKSGKENKQDLFLSPSLCTFFTLVIYMLIFLFSAQVMRGVRKEKANCIVEIIITSISSFQFIASKVIGIALIGLTQIIIWIITCITVSILLLPKDLSVISETKTIHHIKPEQINLIIENINSINWSTIIIVFILFFILGYFLYSSIFAVLGTITKAEQSQQLATLASSPLILSIIMISEVIRDSDGQIVKIFSMIPFTSPIIMVGRSIYGVSAAEICLSLGILFVSTFLIIYIAGRIYHNTIFYTGKRLKITDILQWFKIKNQEL